MATVFLNNNLSLSFQTLGQPTVDKLPFHNITLKGIDIFLW